MPDAPDKAATPSGSPGTARGTRARSVALGCTLVVIAAVALGASAVSFWYPRPDSARYLLAARSLADGGGYTLMGEQFRLRPPGFSLLLAPLVAWRGYDFHALHLLVSAFGVAAVTLFYALLLPRVGSLVSFGAALCLLANPQLRRLCNQLLSDVPGLALALLALVVLRWSDRKPSPARDASLGLALAAAAYVRSANLLLVPALLLHRLLRPRGEGRATVPATLGRIAVPLVVALVAYLPWVLQPPAPRNGVLAPYLPSYSTALLKTDPGDPESATIAPGVWLARIASNARFHAASIASGATSRTLNERRLVLAALGVAGLLLTLALRREAPEWLALGTMALLLVYFEAALRLSLVAFVLVLGAAVTSLRWLATRVARAAVVDGVLTVILVGLAVRASTMGALPDGAGRRYGDLIAATRHLEQQVPPGAPIAGDMGVIYAVLLDRPVLTLGPQMRRGKKEEAEDLLREARPAALVAKKNGALAAMVRRLTAEGHPVVRFGSYVVVDLAPRT